MRGSEEQTGTGSHDSQEERMGGAGSLGPDTWLS